MRIRNVKNASELIESSPYIIKEPNIYKGKFKTLFTNNKRIELEIGMGKGDFIINMALTNPDINYIGVEKYNSVIVRALQKLSNLNLPNLKLIVMDAKKLDEVFAKEISTIYLNFSDPWPKKKHHKRRLTSDIYLNVYENILKEKRIVLKTDNIGLFEYSLISLSNFDYKFKEISLDLHNSLIKNIKTEYETKFSNLGYKINYLEAIKK